MEAKPVPVRRRFVPEAVPDSEAALLCRSDVVPVVSLNGFLP
jgi:hypothetical protein